MAKKNVEQILNGLEKEKLIEILIKACDKDKVLKEKLLFEYGESDSMTNKQLENMLNKVIKSYAGRYKFIEYNQMSDFSDSLLNVLEKISQNMDIKKRISSILTFLTKAIESYNYVDDSNGYIGDVISSTLAELLNGILEVDKLNIKEVNSIFNEVLKYTDNECLDASSEYRIIIFNYLIELVDNDIMRRQLEDRVNIKINEALEDHFGNYKFEALKHVLLDIKMNFGTGKEVEEFIQENLEISTFRKIVIDKFIASKNYVKAIELIRESEEMDKGYAGLVNNWRKLRYEMYKEIGATDEQFKLAKELYDNWNFEYYHELKLLSKGKEKELYEQLKGEARAKNSKYLYSNRMYRELIVEENDLKAILEVAMSHPSSITEYVDTLIGTYEKEVIEIYEVFIKEASESATDRKKYKVVCKHIKEFSKYISLEKKIVLINGLIANYKRRPAFIDELNKFL